MLDQLDGDVGERLGVPLPEAGRDPLQGSLRPLGPVRHQPWSVGILDELRERDPHGTTEPHQRRPSVGEVAEHLLAALAGLVRGELADLTERYAGIAPGPRVEAAHAGRLHP